MACQSQSPSSKSLLHNSLCVEGGVVGSVESCHFDSSFQLNVAAADNGNDQPDPDDCSYYVTQDAHRLQAH